MSEIRIEFTNEPIEIYIETAKQSLMDESIMLVEARQIDRGNSAIVVLGWDEFLAACKSLKPSLVFSVKEQSLINENIEWAISDISRDPSEHEKLKESFMIKESGLLAEATKVCPKYFRCQFYFLSGSAVVVTGFQSSSYFSLINALNDFEEDVSLSRKSERNKSVIELDKKLDGIAEQVAEDEGFIAIRGRRKRAMYVLQKYRSEIPESNKVEKPGQDGDYMDKNIVEVAKRAADIIEFGLSASPFHDDD